MVKKNPFRGGLTMNLAAQLKVLSTEDMQKIHEKVLELLERKGMVFQSDDAV